MKLRSLMLIIGLILLIVVSFAIYQHYSTKKYLDTNKAYFSKEQCEKTTGKQCEYSMCDYIPKGKTVQEVCGDRPGKGYYPIQK